MSKVKPLRDLSSDLITVLFVGLYFLSISTWNPDPHHDGIQFTSGVASANGKIPHLDFFEQYGPLNAFLHGIVLFFFGSKLIVLRILTVVILVLISIAMLSIMRSNNLHATSRSIIVILWALSCPVTSLKDNIYGLYPWPSVTTQLLSLFCVVLLLKIKEANSTSNPKIVLLMLSITTLAILFTRVQVGFLTIGVVIFALGKLEFDTSSKYRIRKEFLVSTSVILLTIWIISLFNKSFVPFIDQIILGPLDVYTNPMKWEIFIGFLKLGIPSAIFLTLIFRLNHSSKSQLTKIGFYFVLTLFFILLQILSYPDRFPNYEFFREFGIGSISNVQSNFLATGYVSALLILILLFLDYKGYLRSEIFFPRIKPVVINTKKTRKTFAPIQRKPNSISSLGVISIMTLPSIALLYPLPSIYHFWWSSPIVLLAYGVGISIIAPKNRFKEIVYLPIFIPTLISLLLSWNNATERDWVTLKSGVFQNMNVDTSYAQSYKEMNDLFLQGKFENISSICFDAMFVSWNGRYSSNGPRIVSWAFGLENSAQPKIAERMFLCSDDEFARNFASTNKVKIIRGLEYNLSWWSKGKIFEYEPDR